MIEALTDEQTGLVVLGYRYLRKVRPGDNMRHLTPPFVACQV